MKSTLRLIFSTALLLATFCTQAQINYAFDEGDNYGNGTQLMVGQREYRWDVDTLNWDNIDSFNMQYNGQDQLVGRNYFVSNSATTWKNNQLSQRMYDANGNILLQVDTSSNPTIGDRYEFTYNGNLEIQKLNYGWSLTNTWANKYRHTTTYTASNKVNVHLTELWQFVNQVWQNEERTIHTYNAQNLDSIITYENWNTTTNQWEGGRNSFYTYDANGNVSSLYIEDFDIPSSLYKPKYKTDYTYDGSNRVTSRTNYDWNVNTNLWLLTFKYTYTYNAQGMLETELTEKWIVNTLQWDLWGLTNYTYDANNRPITELYQNRTNNAWVNSGRNTYTRNANGYRTRWLAEFWNSNTLAFRNYSAIDYWYGLRQNPISGIAELAEDKLFVYPNPTNNPVVFVNAESNLPYSIYDVTGREVSKGQLQKGTNSIILNDAKGTYLLKAGNSTAKLVKQ